MALTSADYAAYIAGKRRSVAAVGFIAGDMSPGLFAHQEAITRWACRLGRCAVFADTGLGKTRIELEWARQVAQHTGGRVLILTPLAVAEQTLREATAMGIPCGRPTDGHPIAVLNYDRRHQISTEDYSGIVLDESSILKSFDGSTRTELIEMWRHTEYRMAATATPAPNDHSELGNHAEFLGICSRAEMLAEYFVHDAAHTQDWRLKGHAVADFWRWVASWGCLLRVPSDLGIDDDVRYALPPLTVRQEAVDVDHSTAHEEGALFLQAARTLCDQRHMRRVTIDARARRIREYVESSDDPCIVWCELNDEGDAVRALLPEAVEVAGADDPDEKASRMLAFADGQFKCLVTKAKIAGFGMNWQHCPRMIFAGPTHSYEQFYQAIRRCWRFGQKRPVEVVILTSPADGAIVLNMRRKADAAQEMAREMLALVRETQLASIMGRRPGTVDLPTQQVHVPAWLTSEV